MLYFIGGTGRTGKSTLARRLVAAKPMLWTSTDLVQSALKRGAPQAGISTGGPGDEQTQAFAPLLEAFTTSQIFYEADSVIEGHVVQPSFVASLRDRDIDFRACFIGWLSIDEDVFLANQGRNTWLLDLPSDEQRAAIESLIPASEDIEAECKRLQLPFVDMAAGPFEVQQAKALALLLG